MFWCIGGESNCELIPEINSVQSKLNLARNESIFPKIIESDNESDTEDFEQESRYKSDSESET